ncbi:TPA: hypothetical protein R1887_005246 [Klebsiella oxytoca]|nr:hypothetical protein [Klebsiella michiganensis]HEC2122639.1 hypothetical protein [Klebsiella oxytoca]
MFQRLLSEYVSLLKHLSKGAPDVKRYMLNGQLVTISEACSVLRLLLTILKELTATGKANNAPGGKNEPIWPRSKRPRACGAGRTGRAGAHPVLSFRVIHISFFFMFSISPLLLLRLF